MNSQSLLLVGHVWRPHGVRGEVKITLETDDPMRLKGVSRLYFGRDSDRIISKEITSMRFQQSKPGRLAIVEMAGVETREEAESLQKMDVFASEEDLPPLAEGEVFIHDLIGFSAATDQGETVGVVRDVLDTPAHLTFLVEREGRADVLIPDVPEIVTHVDVTGAKIVIRPIEGLLET